MPAVDLRDLVGKPISLTGKIAARGNPHPLHEGIAFGHSYPTVGGPPICLPSGQQGLYRLKLSLQEPIAGIEDARAHEAYIRLLGQGVSAHREAGTVTQDADGNPLCEEDWVRARSTLLTAVFHDEGESFDGTRFSAGRFGAVGVLTVLPDPRNQKVIDDAWLDVTWVHNTSAMVRAIQQIPGLRLEVPKLNRRVEILVGETLGQDHEQLLPAIDRIAHLCGVKPYVHVLSEERLGTIKTMVKSNNPAQLLVLGTDVDESSVRVFTDRRGDRDLHRAPVATGDDAVQWLVENLPYIQGVGPALMPQPRVEPVPGRPRLPVNNPVACLHHGNNTYVQDRSTQLWWTRDFARHGQSDKSEFKTYLTVDGALIWQADHAANGDSILDKHKGDEGSKIELNQTHSCAHPESHLR